MNRKSLPFQMIEVASRLLPQRLKQEIYRFGWLAGSLRRIMNRSLPPGLTEVKITAGAAKGMRMHLDLQQEKDYWLGTYEPNLQRTILEIVQPGWVVYDVGANVGYITLMLARQTGGRGRVLALEPLPENVARLRENVSLNGLDERVTILSKAAVASPGKTIFWVGPSDDMGKAEGSAGRKNITYQTSIEVEGVTLDQLVFEEQYPAPNAVKMDIEGGEVLALAGMERLLTEVRPLVFLELHGEESARAAWRVFMEHGYRLHRMEKEYPAINCVDDLDWKSYVVAFPPVGGSEG